MWIVRLALRRPYTFVVLAMLIVLMGIVTIRRMPTDIYPEIDIPVVAAVWSYTGLPPEEMEGRITSMFERAATTTVSGIEHIESQTLAGVGVVKVFMQEGVSMADAVAQVGAISEPILKQLPPGATPPLIIQYSASNVPILQLGLSSATLNEQQILDLGTNFLRPGLVTVRGAQMPLPVGGKYREIVVDLDPQKLFAWGLSPSGVSSLLAQQNVVLPSGTAKIGRQEYPIIFNGSPPSAAGFNDLPLKYVNGTMVYLRDVAHVRDGFAPQTSVVTIDGTRGALLPILKSQGASTLDVVSGIRSTLPAVQATLPPQLEIHPLFDQSVFVKGAIQGVLREAIIAAGLTGLMMLLFLGSWRSTLIVLISIPLSLLVSVILLDRLGQTLNLMTLGGMALAVGILVDDATVEVENFQRQHAMGKPVVKAILDGAAEIAVPAFVSTLCICIVFVPVTLISGVAKFLFIPLALAVVFAMLTSYFLSRTLVPTLEHYLLGREPPGGTNAPGPIGWLHKSIERGFENLRVVYARGLEAAIHHRRIFLAGFLLFVTASLGLVPLLGTDFFPGVDAGEFRLHVRAPSGTRIEETERLFADVEAQVRKIIPADEIDVVINDIGVPVSGINLVLGDPSMISSADGEMLVSLKANHAPTERYVAALRRELRQTFPNSTFFFLPADISTQVLNFGLSAPLDVRITGPAGNQPANLAIARELSQEMSRIPGAVDVHLAQVPETPELFLDVKRSQATQLGLSMDSIASDVLVSLSSSGQTAPAYWMDPKTRVQYAVAVQTPQFRVDSISALTATPVAATSGPPSAQLLENVATVTPVVGPTNVTHYNIAQSIDVQSNVSGTDLGSVARAVQKLIDRLRHTLPRGTTVLLTGQSQAMDASFVGLGTGILFAVVLVYLLLAVNFQSWLEPFIILMALPGTAAGVVWGLFLTGSTLSIPALMGTLMSIGVASANSILVVTFATEQLAAGDETTQAALEAGRTRLRPVIMTATAMILGMLPMSLGLGDGGEQNAPLGRAVIGGLLLATVSTLFFVPVVFSKLGRRRATELVLGENNGSARDQHGV
ncbi:MAG: efflux RND transporter permease subunit [Myxococcaceae bacterium]